MSRGAEVSSIFLVTISLISLSASAQFSRVIVESRSSQEGKNPSLPAVAISRKNPDMMVVSSGLDNIHYSADGGKTWNKSTVTSRFGVMGKSVMTADYSGNFYHLFASSGGENALSPDRIVIRKSKDGGKVWDGGDVLINVPPKQQRSPGITIDRKGNFFATWLQFDNYGIEDPACKTSVFFSKSSNGSKWSKPVKITQFDGDCMDQMDTPRGARPAVTNDGKVFIAWANAGYIWLDRSFNGGDFWLTNDIAITEFSWGVDRGNSRFGLDSGLPVIACDNSTGLFSGALYLVWADERSGQDDMDIWFSRSFNFGDNWTAPLRINDDDPGSNQFSPSMSVDPANGNIYILYYDRRDYEDNRTDVYLAYSLDNGGTFKNVKVNDTPIIPADDALIADFTKVAAFQKQIVLLWTQEEKGNTSLVTTVLKLDDLEGVKETTSKGKKKGKR